MKFAMLSLSLGFLMALGASCIPQPANSDGGILGTEVKDAVLDGLECAMTKYENNPNIDWQTLALSCGMTAATQIAVKMLLAKQAEHPVFAARIAKGVK